MFTNNGIRLRENILLFFWLEKVSLDHIKICTSSNHEICQQKYLKFGNKNDKNT